MTKLFKNSKQVLSCVLALAVLAVSLFTGVVINADAACSEGTIDILEFGDYLLDLGSTSKYFDNKLADNGETGTKDDPIIIDSAEEFVYLAKGSGNETAGKYYKVADGIAGFNLSGSDKLKLNGTLAENIDLVKNSGKNHSGGEPGFQGTFDGNGVTVYGATINAAPVYMGLFPCTSGNVTIKNVNVKFAYFGATNAAGGIIGYHKGDGTNTVVIENCSVTDSYIASSKNDYGCGSGAFIGYTNNCAKVDDVWVNGPTIIKNCFANLDEEYFISASETATDTSLRGTHGGVVGFAVTNAINVSDCVVIGITPYATTANTTHNDVQHTGFEHHFSNVYTTAPTGAINVGGTTGNRDFTGKVFQLTEAQMKGEAAVANMDLDWSVWMADDEGYPELAISHKNTTAIDNEDGTHAETCACGFGGIAVGHTFVGGTCACGAELTCGTRATIGWDGSVATGIATGNGTKEDPYIIKSASELAWLVQQKADATTDKYYKIDDAIGAIVLQSADKAEAIKALDSAAAVKSYFESGSFTAWKTMGWEGSCFAGYFDGNGATIYGMYSISSNNAALFCTVDGGAAIVNLAVKNSYLKSEAPKADYQVGALIGTSSSVGYGAKRQGLVWVNNCIVANNYMYNNSASVNRSGVIGGVQEALLVENCLVYGNDATYAAGVKMPLIGNSNNGVIVGVQPDGAEPKIVEVDGANRYQIFYRNNIVLGTDIVDTHANISYRGNEPSCFENNYTDGVAGEVALANGSWTYAEEQIKKVSADDLKGVAISDAWIGTAGMPELKAFHDAEFTDVQDNGDGTHGVACSCGLAINAEAHTWENGACVCGATCTHKGGQALQPNIKVEPGCTDGGKADIACSICGFVVATDIPGDPLGHDLKAVAGKDATCTEAGTKAYYDCSRCDFVSEDAAGTKAIANLDEWKVIAAKGHTAAKDASGVVYKIHDGKHFKVCDVCSEEFDGEACQGDYVADGANGHTGKCTTCGAETNGLEAHTFGEDNVCDICKWACTEHKYVDGETTELGWDATPDACKTVEQICSICGTKGEDRVIGHVASEWEVPTMDRNYIPSCAGEGQHTEVQYCVECFFDLDMKIVTDAKSGHSFTEYEAADSTCTVPGNIAYKQCNKCWNCFAADAADDEAFENAITSDEIDLVTNPDNHVWAEYGSDADCDNAGVVAHKFCKHCYLFAVEDEETDVAIDWDAFYAVDEETYEPIGPGAKFEAEFDKHENKVFADFVAKNYEDVEVPAFPEDTTDFEVMDAYYTEFYAVWDALYEIDETWNEAWSEYWESAYEAMYMNMLYEALVDAAAEAEIDLVIPAIGHNIVKVDEVAATYDKEGTKAHYACEDCDKLYADAEGKEEVTAESLVIAKLVKENKPAGGDDSGKSPATGESVASVAAVAALMGAAFVLVRKARKA